MMSEVNRPVDKLYIKAVKLLKSLISIPSLSKQEDQTAELIAAFFQENGVNCERSLNNVWAKNEFYDPSKPTILLNSHHDTVKPNKGYTKDPFDAHEEDGRLYGLGSNDAGGALVSLISTFLYFYDKENLKYNFVIAATAEEENSGRNGVESILPQIGNVEFAVVGEPTLMKMAVAEKGLMVFDGTTHGKAGHAARTEGINALYKALEDIQILKDYKFEKESEFLGPIKVSVTQIEAGYQHNVVPDKCQFVVDVRTTDAYPNEEVLRILQEAVGSDLKARSTRLKPSHIDLSHPVIKAGEELGMEKYGSPTTSDQAVIPYQSLKLGPGDSARSHTADEYIYLEEIKDGIAKYIELLSQIC